MRLYRIPMKAVKLKMIFKFGVTVIIVVAIVIYFIGERNLENLDKKDSQEQGKASKIVNEPIFEKNSNSEVKNVIYGHEPKYDINGENPKTIDQVVQGQEIMGVVKQEQQVMGKVIPKQQIFNGVRPEQPKINVKDSNVQPHLMSNNKPLKYKLNSIHLSVVACGERFEEVTVLLKSAMLFTTRNLVFHIFCESDLQQRFRDHLDFWPAQYKSQINYFIYDLTFPSGEDSDKWKKLFKPCASQRLFLPIVLKDVDALIYLDTDVLFTSPIEDLHDQFSKFNDTQLVALTPEHEDAAVGWYNRFAQHPYYGPLGVNSGVMLMNLTRLRNSKWLQSIFQYFKDYKLQLVWGDQDLINIYFHFYPQQLYVLSCEWNYRSDHCMYMSVCKPAEKDGVRLLHGSRRVFFNLKQPAFKAVYTAIKDHKFATSVQYNLITKLKRLLKDTGQTNCGKISHVFTKQIERYAQNNGT